MNGRVAGVISPEDRETLAPERQPTRGFMIKSVKDWAAKATPMDWFLVIIQALIFVASIALLVSHTFPTERGAKDVDRPIIDATTLGLLGALILAALLPRLNEITIGGTTLKFKEAEESAKEFEDLTSQLANLVQNWSTSIAIYLALMDRPPTLDDANRILLDYLRDRMNEAQLFLSDEDDDVARIAIWLFNAENQQLQFFYSTGFMPKKISYHVGEGLLGKAFEERRRFIEADVLESLAYLNVRGGEDPPYRAVICRPIEYGDERLGILTADKKEVGLFNETADEITKGLAAQCAIAIAIWQRVSAAILASTPSSTTNELA